MTVRYIGTVSVEQYMVKEYYMNPKDEPNMQAIHNESGVWKLDIFGQGREMKYDFKAAGEKLKLKTKWDVTVKVKKV